MMITFEHEAARFGRPVILSDGGQLMAYPEGIRAALRQLGWDRKRLAAESGVSVRSVDAWLSGRRQPALAGLTTLYAALRRQRSTGRPPTAGA